jgi:hypothetical protein
VTISWEIYKTRRRTPREWTEWEIECARSNLDRAKRSTAGGKPLTVMDDNDLKSAVHHALTAWFRTHLIGRAVGYEDCRNALLDMAPDALAWQYLDAWGALVSLSSPFAVRSRLSETETVALVVDMVEALLAAATHPPKRRRRYPPSRGRAGRRLQRSGPPVRPTPGARRG